MLVGLIFTCFYVIIPYISFSQQPEVIRYGFTDPLWEVLAFPFVYIGFITGFCTDWISDIMFRYKKTKSGKLVFFQFSDFRMMVGNSILMFPSIAMSIATYAALHNKLDEGKYIYCLEAYTKKCEYIDVMKAGGYYSEINSAITKDLNRIRSDDR